MRTLFTTMFLVFVLLSLCISGCCFGGGGRGGGGGGGSYTPTPVGPATPVDPCAVEDAYRANEVAAGQQYPVGAHHLVTGHVQSVSVSFGDTITVHSRLHVPELSEGKADE